MAPQVRADSGGYPAFTSKGIDLCEDMAARPNRRESTRPYLPVSQTYWEGFLDSVLLPVHSSSAPECNVEESRKTRNQIGHTRKLAIRGTAKRPNHKRRSPGEEAQVNFLPSLPQNPSFSDPFSLRATGLLAIAAKSGWHGLCGDSALVVLIDSSR